MTEARRLFEREGHGYGRIAEHFKVSKPAVQGWARRGGWQRGIGVAPKQNAATEAKAGEAEGAKFTGMPKNEPREEGIHTPATASRAESADAPDAIDLGEIGLPANFAEMSFEERLVAAEAAALKRIDEMIARQERASNAALSLLYSAMKASRDGDKNANARIRGAEVTHKALKLAHEEQRTQERQRVLRAYRVIEGVTPPKAVQPSFVVVFSDDSPLTGGAGRGVRRRVACGDGDAGLKTALQLMGSKRAAAADVTDVEPNGETQ